MNEEINRVSADLNVWRSREERFEKLFPGSLQNNRPFLKEKLDYLDGIQGKYRRSANEMERLTLRILEADRNKLAKLVYPNWLARMIRIILLPFKKRRIERTATTRSITNISALQNILSRIGFGEVTNQLSHEIRQNQDEFIIPVSYYVNDQNRMDYSLSFAKNQSGAYQFEGFKAVLNSEQNANDTKQQHFPFENKNIPTAEQAYNLLAGRSIRIDRQNGNESSQTSWVQLDFNDKNSGGNYRLKEFPVAYGYDLPGLIKQLPLESALSPEFVESMITSLAAGNQYQITIKTQEVNQQYLIEANPQFKSLNIYNEQGKKVQLTALLKSPTAPVKKQSTIININQGANRKNGLSA